MQVGHTNSYDPAMAGQMTMVHILYRFGRYTLYVRIIAIQFDDNASKLIGVALQFM